RCHRRTTREGISEAFFGPRPPSPASSRKGGINSAYRAPFCSTLYHCTPETSSWPNDNAKSGFKRLAHQDRHPERSEGSCSEILRCAQNDSPEKFQGKVYQCLEFWFRCVDPCPEAAVRDQSPCIRGPRLALR